MQRRFNSTHFSATVVFVAIRPWSLAIANDTVRRMRPWSLAFGYEPYGACCYVHYDVVLDDLSLSRGCPYSCSAVPSSAIRKFVSRCVCWCYYWDTAFELCFILIWQIRLFNVCCIVLLSHAIGSYWNRPVVYPSYATAMGFTLELTTSLCDYLCVKLRVELYSWCCYGVHPWFNY